MLRNIPEDQRSQVRTVKEMDRAAFHAGSYFNGFIRVEAFTTNPQIWSNIKSALFYKTHGRTVLGLS
jgi:hypothetical protein